MVTIVVILMLILDECVKIKDNSLIRFLEFLIKISFKNICLIML